MALVLVVDDEQGIRLGLRRVLGREGHTVALAENGQDGARIFQEQPDITVVLSDVNMPIMTGPGMHRAIADELCSRGAHFGFMSAGAMSAEDMEYVRASGIPVLPKPSAVEVIIAFVNTLLAT